MPNDSPNVGGLSRRSLLKVGAAGCTGAFVATSIASSPLSQRQSRLNQWRSAIGQDVRIVRKSHSDERSFRPLTLRLVDVEQLEIKPQPGQKLPNHVAPQVVSLCLQGDMRTTLESASYQVEFPAMGEFELFINEIQSEPDQTERTFESIIS